MYTTVFDLETHLIRPGQAAPKPVCLSFSNRSGIGLLTAVDGAAWLLESLQDINQRVVAHNGAYDFACIMAWHPEVMPFIWEAAEKGRYYDTRIRERLLDIATGTQRGKGGYSLASIAKRRFGIEMDKDTWRLGYSELEGIPLKEWPKGAVDYAKLDAEVTAVVWGDQEKEIEKTGYTKEEFNAEAARQSSYQICFQLMSTWGIKCNKERVEDLHERVKEEYAQLRDELLQTPLVQMKKTGEVSRKMDAIREEIKKSYPGTLPLTDKGKIKTDSDTIAECNSENLRKIERLAGLQKLENTYIKPMLEGTKKPIHAYFDTLGADSGRSSCSRPNLQNQPRLSGLRECFEARKGYVYVACDYDTQELRTLAQTLLDVVGQSCLAERYRKDPEFDPHTQFAAQMLQITYEEGLKRKTQDDEAFLDARQRAKAANFGLPGGLGAKALVKFARNYGLNLSELEATEIKTKWFSTWPEMVHYFRWINNISNNGFGSLVLPRSRRRRGRVYFTEAANGGFSGPAADCSKTALWMVAKKCYTEPESPLYGSRPVVFIHDEIILESPEHKAAEAAYEMAKLMQVAQEMWTPDIPARASAHLMRYWTKAAKAVYKDGKLIPWEDR